MNVVSIQKAKEPDPTIVAALEEMLQLAKAGEIVSLAMIGLRSDKNGQYCSLGTMSAALIGHLEMVKSDVLNFMREHEED